MNKEDETKLELPKEGREETKVPERAESRRHRSDAIPTDSEGLASEIASIRGKIKKLESGEGVKNQDSRNETERLKRQLNERLLLAESKLKGFSAFFLNLFGISQDDSTQKENPAQVVMDKTGAGEKIDVASAKEKLDQVESGPGADGNNQLLLEVARARLEQVNGYAEGIADLRQQAIEHGRNPDTAPIGGKSSESDPSSLQGTPFRAITDELRGLPANEPAAERRRKELTKEVKRRLDEAEDAGELDTANNVLHLISSSLKRGNFIDPHAGEYEKTLSTQTDIETQQGKINAGLEEYYFKLARAEAIRSVPSNEMKERAEAIDEQADRVFHDLFNRGEEGPQGEEALAGLQGLLGSMGGESGRGFYETIRRRREDELEVDYEAFARQWVWDRLKQIDKVEVSPQDLVWFRVWNEVLQSLPTLPTSVLLEVGGWKLTYAASSVLSAAGELNDLRGITTDMEDAMAALLQGRDRYSSAIRRALVLLDSRSQEYMRPRVNIGRNTDGSLIKEEELASDRRKRVITEIGEQITRQFGFNDEGELMTRIADRIWALSGVKAMRDRISTVYKVNSRGEIVERVRGEDEDETGYSWGRDPMLDRAILRWGNRLGPRTYEHARAFEVYGFAGDGKFFWRRIYRAHEAFAQEKNVPWLPSMVDKMTYGKDGGPFDFFSTFSFRNNGLSNTRFLDEGMLERISFREIKTRYAIYIDQLVKSDKSRLGFINPEGPINVPNVVNLLKLRSVFENVDDKARDAIPSIIEGYIRAGRRRGTVEQLIGHGAWLLRYRQPGESFLSAGGRRRNERMDRVTTGPDGRIIRVASNPHYREFESEFEESLGTNFPSLNKEEIENLINTAVVGRLMDPSEGERLKRKYCSIDLGGLLVRRHIDPSTGVVDFEPIIPGYGWVRTSRKVIRKIPGIIGIILGSIFAGFRQTAKDLSKSIGK